MIEQEPQEIDKEDVTDLLAWAGITALAVVVTMVALWALFGGRLG